MKDRVERDGQVAVMVSYGYGAGWSSWNSKFRDVCLFHPAFVALVEDANFDEMAWGHAAQAAGLGDAYLCLGGIQDIQIVWVPKGAGIQVTDHDGAESIVIREDWDWAIA